MKIGITERGDASLHYAEWVSKLDTVAGAILITKDPRALFQKIRRLQRKGKIDTSKLIIHCTITGWGGTYLEPNVPVTAEALAGYFALINRFGGERVVLRIDPIIPILGGVKLAKGLYSLRKGRVRISFLDLYPHTLSRLDEEGYLYRKLTKLYEGQLHAPLSTRSGHLNLFEDAEVCGEPGLSCYGCVSVKDLEVMDLYRELMQDKEKSARLLQISKQRPACKCRAVKTELLTNRRRCGHKCLYCYWKD